jgi:cell division protein FtsA
VSEIITAIDVGTTKICTFIAERTPENELHLLGAGCKRSRGLRRGVVVNIAAATEAIADSVEAAEEEAGVTIEEAYVGIVGGHISFDTNRAAISIPGNRAIDWPLVNRVLSEAQSVPVMADRDIIHVIARTFTVDGQEGVQEPIGMHGRRLEVDAYIVTGARTAINNLKKCVENNGIVVKSLVLEPLASGEAVLTPEEKEAGVAVVDIGGGTTDIAIYLNGTVWHTTILQIGGNHFTKDLSTILHTPFPIAEKLKIRYGHVLPEYIPPDETVDAPSFGGKPNQTYYRQYIAEILSARAEELLLFIQREINRSGYGDLLSAGLVLTGGGARLVGIDTLGRELLGTPVRIGSPVRLGDIPRRLLTPENACGIGLLLQATQDNPYETTPSSPGGDGTFAEKLAHWLRNLLPG